MNVFDLSAKITLDTSEYEKELKSASNKITDFSKDLNGGIKSVDELGDETEEAGKQAQNAGDGYTVFKNVLANLTTKAILAAAEGMKKLISAIGDMEKAVISAYGNYEQLVGGVEKLFGDDASKKVIENAERAYKTAGLSANAYMETVTNFSASLISSLGGDTQKAVDYADMALQDMSDNANVFGTDIGMIQNAYQGFAKQNYMMLDNLKLGYGGTKTEMERLIDDANKLKVAQGGMADLTIERYADIIEAIHLVQKNMNITGTTAKEASQTIEGSINSLKGAVTNLWTEFGKGDGDIKKATKSVTSGFQTVLKNIIPIVKNITKALPDAIGEIVKQLPRILPSITKVIKGFIDSVFQLAKGFISSLPSILQEIPNLVRGLTQNIVKIIKDVDWLKLISDIAMGALSTIFGVFQGIDAALSESSAAWYEHRDAIREATIEYQNALDAAREMNDERKSTYDNLYAEIGIMEDVKNKLIEYTDEQGHVKQGYEDEMGALAALAEAKGIHIEVVNGEIQGYSDLISSIDVAIEKRKQEAITAAETSMYEEAYKKRRELDGEYQTHYNAYLDNMMAAEQARAEGRMADADKYFILANDELKAAQTLKDGIVEYSAQMELASHNMAAAASGDFDSLATTYDEAGINLSNYEKEVQDTTGKIQSRFEKTFGVELPKAIKDGDEEVYMQMQYDYRAIKKQAEWGWQEIGDASIDGFTQKMNQRPSRVVDAAVRTVRDAINAAKAEAQISSPSKVWGWMGDMMTLGLTNSLEDGSRETANAARNMVKDINNAMSGLENINDMLNGAIHADIDNIGIGDINLKSNNEDLTSEILLTDIVTRLDNFEQNMYDAMSRVLRDGLDLRFNDRELTRLVKEHA